MTVPVEIPIAQPTLALVGCGLSGAEAWDGGIPSCMCGHCYRAKFGSDFGANAVDRDSMGGSELGHGQRGDCLLSSSVCTSFLL